MGAPAGRSERRGRRRERLRQELVTAAMKLFRERGYDAVTVNDVADAVGISRRTFFRYFDSKDDVVFDWMTEQGQFMTEMLKSRSATEPPFEAMKAVLLELARVHDRRADVAYFRTKLIFETPALAGRFHLEDAQWTASLAKALAGRRRGSARDALWVRVQTSMATAAFIAATRCWLDAGGRSELYPWVAAAFAKRPPRRSPGQG